MFHADSDRKRFRSVDPPAITFDVLDFSVLDTALQQIEQAARRHFHDDQKLILIEFARDEYRGALSLFSTDFLRDAFFLFIDADIDTCMRHIHERCAHPTTSDDYFVSDDMLKTYYSRDNRSYLTSYFASDFGIAPKQVLIINNMGSLHQFMEQLEQFTMSLLKEIRNNHDDDPQELVLA